eukprot:13269211-Ditylum_brightwellii.AAC.1
MKENILNKLRYAGTYRDDGLTIYREQLSCRQGIHWLCHFQIQLKYGTYRNTTICPPWKHWTKSCQMKSGGDGKKSQ